MDVKIDPTIWSSLSLVARNGDVEKLKALLKQGRRTNTEDKRGWRPLHHAAYTANIECVQLLLKCSDVAVNALSIEGVTALHALLITMRIPSREKDPKILTQVAKVMLEAGANPNAEGGNLLISILNRAILMRYPPLVRLLIDYKIDLRMRDDTYGTAVDAAAMSGSLEILEMILSHKLMLHRCKTDKYPFFHTLIRKFSQNEPLLRAVLKKPECVAQLNDQDRQGNTPLCYACRIGAVKAINLLLDYGANPNIRNADEALPLNLAALTLPDMKDKNDASHVFMRLYRMTCRREIRSYYSSVVSSLVFCLVGNGTKKNMLKLVIDEDPELVPTSIRFPINAVSTYFCSSEPLFLTEFMSYFWDTSFEFSPLVVWLSDIRHNDYETFEMLMKNADVNDDTNDKVLPLIEMLLCEDALQDFESDRFRLLHYLLCQGADVSMAYRECFQLGPSFIVDYTPNLYVVLEFLLLHSIPGEELLGEEGLQYLLQFFKAQYTLEGEGESLSTGIQYGLIQQFINFLLVIDRYVPRIPQTALKIIQYVNAVPILDIPNLPTYYERLHHSSHRTQLFDRFNMATQTPKTLSHLCILKTRQTLWKSRKDSLISSSILKLAETVRLPRMISKQLMFNVASECQRIGLY